MMPSPSSDSTGAPLPFSVPCPSCKQKTKRDLRPAGGNTAGDPLFRHSCGKTITISAFQALEIMSISQKDARKASHLLMEGKSFTEVRRLTLLSQPKLECLEYLHDNGLPGLIKILDSSIKKRQVKRSGPKKTSKSQEPKVFNRQNAAEFILLEIDSRHGLELDRTQAVGDVIEAAVKRDRKFFRGFRFTEVSLEMGVPRDVILKCLRKAHWSLKPRSK